MARATWPPSGQEVFHTSVIPVGGNHVTNDPRLACAARNEAERIKLQHGRR